MAKIAVMVGSVYGAAIYVAEQAQALLSGLGHEVRLYEEAKLDEVQAFNADIWLVISSTTGQGDIPDNLLPFYLDVQNRFPLLTGKQFAVIALGDSSYDTFCGAGEQLRDLLLEIQAAELSPMLRIDAGETLEPETIALPWLKQQFSALS
ncbi:MAG: flavodoxin [Gammaproteobacteria bacterium]|nr:flavodoxin [Gammaproteobacteria bacterium]MBU1555880.1 flavodoxin [Gammaproteobacteria bacterium]MBU2071472.1 flavodoxin [Gammaproteobacteria bacterium]MBU2182484.1 flavodoxin [Gammaproteobacteria bacterium]MBU2205866.1 flavodoxin [Gammaproteobacteria bacterium]